MRIALLGYGKMGKVIEAIALQRGHTIVLKVSSEIKNYTLTDVDVAIEFSTPESAVENITHCLHHNVPVICGTTGWLEDYDTMMQLCNDRNGAFIYESNFSLGVNIFFELNTTLAKLMRGLPQYNVSIEEIHHTQKLDAPSGTAITLANDIIAHSEYQDWTLENPNHNELPIVAKR